MKLLKEQALFFKRAVKDIHAVGSIIPSSRSVAKSMTEAMRRKSSPRTILEVGAGTGPITARIVREMQAGDQLDIYEIDGKMCDFLQGRFEREEAFKRVAGQVKIFNAGINTIPHTPRYDIIISAVPFTNLPPDAVTEFFETYRTILKPDGVFTYIEFALGRAMFTALARGDEKKRMKQVGKVVKQYRRDYLDKKRFVPLNMPPANIYSLQFNR